MPAPLFLDAETRTEFEVPSGLVSACLKLVQSPTIDFDFGVYSAIDERGRSCVQHKSSNARCSAHPVGILFVEDTDLVVMGEKDEEETAFYSRLQQAINFWNGILRVSRGTLKP